MSIENELASISCDFLTWLWFTTEKEMGSIDLGAPHGRVDFWVDERLAFRNQADDKPIAVMTGENPSTSLEARAALAGGKVLRDLRIGLRVEEREYTVTLRGPLLDFASAKVPPDEAGGDEAIYDRMYFYEELHGLVRGLFTTFSNQRTSPEWGGSILPAMRSWINGADAEA
jgi:hypothetical protein